jgi:hypothetical protein
MLSLWSATISSIILIGATAFYWDIVDIFTPFLAPLLMLGFWMCFFASGVFCLVMWLQHRKTHFVQGATAIIIHFLTLIIVIYVPFHTIMLDLNFRLNYHSRMQVVAMVEQQKRASQTTTEEIEVSLPNGYRHLSRGGGDIIVDRSPTLTIVFFYTFRGILGSFSGFMYRSDNSSPQQDDLGGEYVQIEKLRDHWYWVAAT